ncbi:MAG: hypothetical protein WB723_19530 [Candidatus Acidiferrales bacterium]
MSAPGVRLLSCFQMDITPKQAALLQRIHSGGFELIAFPVYPNHVGIRRGNCAALLAPVVPDSFKVFAEPAYLIDGNLSARITLDGHDYFIWKKQRLEATAPRRAELASFRDDLTEALLPIE